MTEKQLQEAVTELAALLGWDAYHTHDSRHSAAGFPDLVLRHDGRTRVLFRELKTDNGHLSAEQSRWLEGLQAAGCDVGVWWESDWQHGTIESELRS